jgi:hypothetical protein
MVRGRYGIKMKQIIVLFFEVRNLFPGRPLHPPQKKEKETLLRY